MQEQFKHLRRFAFSEKFKLSFNNALAFVGNFIDNSDGVVLGKELHIPLSDKHPALTLVIASTPFVKEEIESLIIHFKSHQERQLIDCYDFAGDIFFVEK